MIYDGKHGYQKAILISFLETRAYQHINYLASKMRLMHKVAWISVHARFVQLQPAKKTRSLGNSGESQNNRYGRRIFLEGPTSFPIIHDMLNNVINMSSIFGISDPKTN